jgi:hypothetical protein
MQNRKERIGKYVYNYPISFLKSQLGMVKIVGSEVNDISNYSISPNIRYFVNIAFEKRGVALFSCY